MTDTPHILTFSALNKFRTCERMYRLRYEDEIVPKGRAAGALAFGSLIHQCLETWYGFQQTASAGVSDWSSQAALVAILSLIDTARPDRDTKPWEKKDWMLARAMMTGYAARYPVEPFTVSSIEQTFTGTIVNPETGAQSRTFTMAGKLDMMVTMADDGRPCLVEHKTARTVGEGYRERLWCDTQIALYVHYAKQFGFKNIAGVLYNVLLKAGLQQSVGETEEEYAVRAAELAAKNKSGKSNAKRRLPETDDEFSARLMEWYGQPKAFHREMIYITPQREAMLEQEVWEITQRYLAARRRGVWLPNTAACWQYNRACDYWPLCSSDMDPLVLDECFEHRAAHEELGLAEAERIEDCPF